MSNEPLGLNIRKESDIWRVLFISCMIIFLITYSVVWYQHAIFETCFIPVFRLSKKTSEIHCCCTIMTDKKVVAFRYHFNRSLLLEWHIDLTLGLSIRPNLTVCGVFVCSNHLVGIVTSNTASNILLGIMKLIKTCDTMCLLMGKVCMYNEPGCSSLIGKGTGESCK